MRASAHRFQILLQQISYILCPMYVCSVHTFMWLCLCLCMCKRTLYMYQVHISQVFFSFESNCTSCRNAVATLLFCLFVIQFKTKLRLFTFRFFRVWCGVCFFLISSSPGGKIHVCGDVTNICINKKCATDTKTIILMQFTNRKKERKYF